MKPVKTDISNATVYFMSNLSYLTIFNVFSVDKDYVYLLPLLTIKNIIINS